MTLNDLIRQRVRKRANYYCEYCHSPEQISASRFTIDHIQPLHLVKRYHQNYRDNTHRTRNLPTTGSE